jgi:hypothetical protein
LPTCTVTSYGCEFVIHDLFGVISTEAPVSSIKMLGSVSNCNELGNCCSSSTACRTSSSMTLSLGDVRVHFNSSQKMNMSEDGCQKVITSERKASIAEKGLRK